MPNQIFIINFLFLLNGFSNILRINFLTPVNSEPDTNVCLTKQCNETAAAILENMNTNVLPCNDFYRFVCGKFIERTTLPSGTHRISVTTKWTELTETLVQSYLQENPSAEKYIPYEKAFKLYKLCEDERTVETQEVIHLRQTIEKIGGWPVVEGQKWKETNWEKAVGELSKLGFNAGIFFDIRITMAMFNRPMIIELHPMNFKQLSYKSVLDVSRVAMKLGANLSENIESIIENSVPVAEYQDNSKVEVPELFQLEDLKKEWPIIDWRTYFEGYFSVLQVVTIPENLFVYVKRSVINKVVNLLATTPKSTIMNYIIGEFVEGSLPYLSPQITLLGDHTNNESRTSPQRQKYCAQLVTHELPRMVQAIFALSYVNEKLINDFNNMSGAVKIEMGKLINQATWLDNQTRKYFTDKLSNVTYDIGFSDEIKSNEFVREYNDLELDERSFLHSMWSIRGFKEQIRLRKIIGQLSSSTSTSPPPKLDIMNMLEVNGIYKHARNRIVIMPGHFHDLFFYDELPKYLNYGGIGVTIGHELSHAFPSNSRWFRQYRNISKMSNVVRREFLERIHCYVSQYNNYVIADLNKTMNGLSTVRENVADNVGVKLTYLSYKDWVEQNTPDLSLPNMNYTPMQMFWISYAKSKCTKYDLVDLDNNETHSLKEFRINGPLSNSPEFSKDFNCSPGTPMNPINKCKLW